MTNELHVDAADRSDQLLVASSPYQLDIAPMNLGPSKITFHCAVAGRERISISRDDVTFEDGTKIPVATFVDGIRALAEMVEVISKSNRP